VKCPLDQSSIIVLTIPGFPLSLTNVLVKRWPASILKGNNNNKCWQGLSETGTRIHCWWESKLVQPLWKAVWRFFKKLKIELPYDPVILLLGISIKEHKSVYNRDICTLMCILALFTKAKFGSNP
jgi:hypothetical protein